MNPDTAPVNYNFSRGGHLSPEQLRVLQTIQEQCARSLTHTLSAWLRTQFLVTAQPSQQKAFASFLTELPSVSYVCSLRLEPHSTHGAVQLDLVLAPPIIDVLLGGNGRTGELRDLTEIEEAIVLSVTDLVVREMTKAWQSTGIAFALGKRERDGQLQRLMAANEKTVHLSFEIAMPEASGTLTLCLPAVALSSVLRAMVAQRETERRRSPELRARMEDRLAAAQVSADLSFPGVRLRARDITHMEPGQVLRLPLPTTSPAHLRVNGRTLFYATPARCGEHRAAHLRLAAHTHDRLEGREAWNQ